MSPKTSCRMFWDNLTKMGNIGGTPAGSVNRIFFTDAHGLDRGLCIRRRKKTDFTVKINGIGNMFARLLRHRLCFPIVLTSNHLESAPTRVKFDSAIVVPVGLDFVQTLNEQGIATELLLSIDQRAPVESVGFNPKFIQFNNRMATEEGRPSADFYAGAGHDAGNVAKLMPTASIFVPCEYGINRNEAENKSPQDPNAGRIVLRSEILTFANNDVAA